MGTNDLMKTYSLVKKSLNPDLKILAFVITLFDPRTNIAREAASEIREVFKDRVCATVVHRRVKLEEAPASGKSIFEYAPKSLSAYQYREVYKEIKRRIEKEEQMLIEEFGDEYRTYIKRTGRLLPRFRQEKTEKE